MAPRKRCIEFVLQATVMLAGAGAFVAALVAEIKFKNLSQLQMTIIEQASNLNDQDDLFVKTEATAGLVFATTAVAALIGFFALVGRVFNAEHNPTNRRIFATLYLLYSLVCFLGFSAAGILGAFTAVDWSDILSNRLSRFLIDTTSLGTEVENIQISVAATSAFSLLAALLYGALEVVVLFCCSTVKDY